MNTRPTSIEALTRRENEVLALVAYLKSLDQSYEIED